MIYNELKLMFQVVTTTVQPSLLFIFIALAMISAPTPLLPLSIAGFGLYGFVTFLVTSSYVVWLHNANQLRMPIQQLNRLAVRSYIMMIPLPIIMITTTTVLYDMRPPLWVAATLLAINAAVTAYMLLPTRQSWPLAVAAIIFIIWNASYASSSPFSPMAPHAAWYLSYLAAALYFLVWIRWKTIRNRPYSRTGAANELAEVLVTVNSTASNKTTAQWYALLPTFFVPRFDPLKPRNARQRMSVLMGPLFANTLRRNSSLWWMATFIAVFYLFIAWNEGTRFFDNGMIAYAWILMPDSVVERGLFAFLTKQPQDVTELLLLPGLGDAKRKLHSLIGLLCITTLKTIAICALITLLVTVLLTQPLSRATTLMATAGLSSLVTTFTHCLFTLTRAVRRSHQIDGSNMQRQGWGIILILVVIAPLMFIQRPLNHPPFGIEIHVLFSVLLIVLSTYIMLGYRWYRQLKALPHPFVEIAR